VGEVYWVDKKLADALVGDSFRIVPRNQEDAYFIYAVLASSYARDYVSGATYGSVVDHASVDQVRSLPVPAISDRHRARVSDLVKKALLARGAAYDLLDASEAALLRANGLGELRNPKSAAFDPLGQPECFAVDAKTVRAGKGDRSEYRLDAHFYNPTAQLAIANIRKGRSEVKTVGDVTREIRMSPLFVRKYVAKEHGVPYIAGKQISQIRPEFKYISRTATEDLDEHILHKGWTLMTCAGSVGKVGYVSGSLIGAAAQDVMRVIPDEMKVDGGYLNAWLASEYGRVLVVRCRYGSVVDRVSPQHVGSVLIPLASAKEQRAIGDKVREAYAKRVEAIRLEDEAQAILTKELTKAPGIKEA